MKNWQQFIWGMAIGLVVLAAGGPVLAAAPTVSPTAAVTTDTTAGWTWTGTAGSYRNSLDIEDAWQETTDTSFTPGVTLAKGEHTLFVQESDGNGNWSSSGSASLYCLATETDGTVLLSDAADMKAFSTYVNAVPANGTVNAKLTNDIDLNGNLWQPIGKDINYIYRGVFDSQNYVISGLNPSAGNAFTGLFGMSRGTIKNLTITGSTIVGGNDVGAIVGMANSGSQIINCHNLATVNGNLRVGGIAGSFMGSLENCSNRGAVTGVTGNIGGIVGCQQGNIANCFNSGDVRSTITDYMANVQIGGITGSVLSGATRCCYNTGMVITATSGGSIKQGAIIGETYLPQNVTNCYYLDTTAIRGIGNSSDVATQTARINLAGFTSGEVCHGLQAGQATPIWGQTLTGSPDPGPVLSNLPEKQVHRVILDYADTTPDQTSYHNQNASVAIPQTADDAISLDGAPFTASSYTVGSSDATFIATKREDLTGITVSPYNGSFDGSSHPLVTVTGAPADAVISYSSSGEAGSFTATRPELTDVGSATIYVKVSDFYHYDYLSSQLTATVTRASAPTVGPLAKSYLYTNSGFDDSVDVTTLLPANRGASSYALGTIDDSSGILDVTPTIGVADGILSYRVTGGAIGATATIPVIIASANYEPITVDVVITLTDKQALTIAGIVVSNKTYDGQPLAPTGSVIITDGGGQAVAPGPLSYRYHSTDGGGYDSSVAPTAAGSYALDISVPTDNPSYRGALGPLSFDILRRPLEIRALSQTITVGGDRLADGYAAPDLVAGETLTGISYSCDYLKNDGVKGKAGSYPITPSGGVISGGNENYLIGYQPGLLTVNPASSGGGGAVSPTVPGVTLGTDPLVFDAAGHLAVAISGLPAGATVYYSSDGLSYGTTAPVMTGVGRYPLYVRVSCPGYADYLTRTEVTVAKAAPPPVAELIVAPPADQVDGTVLLAAELPPNPGATQFEMIDVADPEQLLGDAPVIDENGQLRYRLRQDPVTDSRESAAMTSNQTAAGATVLIRVTMANYEDLTLTVVIAKESAEPIGIRYLTHIQDIGWERDWVTAGALSGTAGQSKRLEALKVELTGEIPADASIDTAVHVQNLGDLGPFAMGSAAGTSGKSLRLENISLTLNNLPGYSLRYNVHVQNQGWLRDEADPSSWFTSGEVAGTSGKSLRLEAIRIELVKDE